MRCFDESGAFFICMIDLSINLYKIPEMCYTVFGDILHKIMKYYFVYKIGLRF